MTAGGPNQIQTVDLSALADRSGLVRLDRLAALTASSDVVVGEVLDEELVLCRGLAGWPEEPDPHWAPYLWPLAPPLRSVSIRTVERLDVAQDTIEYPEDAPDEFACDPLLDGVLHAFRHAVAQLTWRHGPGQRGGWAGATLVLDDGIVLHDDIDTEAGQHLLVFRSREREAIYVAGGLDPDDRAGNGLSKAQRESSGPAPDLQQLTATAVATTTLQRGPVWCSGTPERTVRAFGTDDGLWLLDDHGRPAETNEPYRASAADIDDLAAQFLTRWG